MEFTSFCNGDLSTDLFFDGFRKLVASVATVNECPDNLIKAVFISVNHLECTLTISHIGGGYMYCVRQSIGVDTEMSFDARNLLAGIIAFRLGCICILHTLGINDAVRCLFVSTIDCSDLANQFFLKLGRVCLDHHLVDYSISESRHGLIATSESH